MQLTFLQAAVPLTKKYTKRSDGGYDKTSYPNIFKITSHVEEVDGIESFAAALRKHAETGNCLHTGSFSRKLQDESRKGHHDKDEKRSWIVLDLDGVDYPDVETLISELPDPFHKVSYIEQHSPSSGLKPGLNMHLFFLLDREEDMTTVSATIRHLNFVTASLRDKVTLTTSNKILSLPLDWVANKNGRVVYIAHPECVGFEDPIEERIKIVKKEYEQLRYNFYSVTPGDMKFENRKLVDELRATASLPKLRVKDLYETTKAGHEVLKKNQTERGKIHDCQPDSNIIMRCNIDGGDSHAYFYYIGSPGLIRNHKGEPNIYMEAFDPDFYRDVAMPAARAAREKDLQPFVFRNQHDDKWYVGLRIGGDIVVQPHVIGSRDRIEDYFTQHGGLGVPDPIETWRKEFNPRFDEQWNPDNRVFNTWRKTELMFNAMYRTLPPPIITKIISHVVGNDEEAYNRFTNWLAYVYQNRTKTGTAWILHGVQGTGKGLLVDRILTPILGHDYVVKQQSRNLKAEFNGWMEQAIIVNLDEFDLQDTGADAGAVMQALKMWITDERLPLRAMYKESRPTDNYSNFILTTNARSAMPVDVGDRRFSFGVRQEQRLEITPEEVETIASELQDFAGYLSSYDVDKALAHTCLENQTKEQAKELSLTSIEEFVEAVHEGDLQFFLDARHERSSDYATDGEYKKLLDKFIHDCKEEQTSIVEVHELLIAYKVICRDDKNVKGAKFRKIMAHKNQPARRLKLPDGTRPFGWRVKWQADEVTLRSVGGHIKPVKSQKELEDEVKKEVESP